MKEAFASFWKKVKIFIFFLLFVGIGVVSYILMGHYSEGYRGGTLIKLSHKGMVFKTLEGQLNIGTFLDNGKNNPLSPIWDFSVKHDDKLFEKLNNAILSNKRVKLHYREMFVKLPWRGETNYVVDEVEIMQ